MMMNMMGFDVTLGIDWLYHQYVTIDCRWKKLHIEVPKDKRIEFKVRNPDDMGRMLVS